MTAGSPSFRAVVLRERAVAVVGIVCGAVMLCWTAAFNRFPLFYPDSMVYLEGARVLSAAIFAHVPIYQTFEPRAEFYCLGLYFLCHGAVPWAMVFLQAMVVAGTIWMVVRWVVPRRPVVPYLAIVGVLSAASGLSWVVCWVLTDVFGGPAYLCVALLVFGWQPMGRWERVAAVGIGWWSIVAHPTHLILSVFVWALAGLLLLLPWGAMRGRWSGLWVAAALLVFSACSLEGIHAGLYGEASLTGKHPPYLMARVVADGPGRLYLQQHCPVAGWVLCEHVHTLPASSEEILWGPNDVWLHASPEERLLLRRQEMPLVVAAVRAYPGLEVRRALRNGWSQMVTCGFDNFVDNEPIRSGIRWNLPNGYDAYERSAQARGMLPIAAAVRVQMVLLCAAGAALLVCVPMARRRRATRSLAMAAVLLAAVVANALVCGALSQVDARLQLRIVWLFPLAAMLVVAEMLSPGPIAATSVE